MLESSCTPPLRILTLLIRQNFEGGGLGAQKPGFRFEIWGEPKDWRALGTGILRKQLKNDQIF